MILIDNGLQYSHETPTKEEIHRYGEPMLFDYVAVACTKDGKLDINPKSLWYWGTELQAFKLLNCWNRRGTVPLNPHAHWSFYAV
jgi:hypothetical protein